MDPKTRQHADGRWSATGQDGRTGWGRTREEAEAQLRELSSRMSSDGDTWEPGYHKEDHYT
jgi:hypothetical protein